MQARKNTPESSKTRASGSVPCERCSSEDGDKKVNKIYLTENAGRSKSLFNIYIRLHECAVKYRLLVAIFFFFDLYNNNKYNIVSLFEFPRENSTTGTLHLSTSTLSHPTSECYRMLYYIIII